MLATMRRAACGRLGVSVRRLGARRCLADDSKSRSASMHRSAITQELWSLRRMDKAPAPPRADGTRTPGQTRVMVRYAFSEDEELRNRYESAFGTLRFGVLLEDMDAIAGSVAWRHVDDDDETSAAPLLVTASVDAIEVRDQLALDRDYVLVGSMIWTGRSSLEIAVELRSVDSKGRDDKVALGGVFTFVARTADGAASSPVPQLVPETAEERARYDQAAAKQAALKRDRQRRKAESATAAEEDDARIQALLAHSRIAADFPGLADDGVIEMARTGLRHASLCHPQDRNTAGRVFGGVLMRRALELAYATAFAFGGRAPQLRALDRVEFVRPVDVGALLALKSTVTLTEMASRTTAGFVHVNVAAAAWRPDVRSSELTNTFSFVFALEGIDRPLKKIQPGRTSEAKLQLYVKRRLPPAP